MEKMFKFNLPTQVKFLDFDGDDDGKLVWLGGIAYQDVIICGCCGVAIDLEKFWEDWYDLKDEFPEVESPLVVYAAWVDIEEFIRGE